MRDFYFIYLFLFLVGLLLGLFSSCGKWGLLSSCAARVSHLVASLLAEHRL